MLITFGVRRSKWALQPWRSARRRSYSAFTLIELVVVFGLIFVLMGLLVPSLGRVRSHGRLTTLLGEIQQHAVLIDLYADDHDDVYPFADKGKVGLTARAWYEPLLDEHLLEGETGRRAAAFQMSLCMVYDAKRMVPGNTPHRDVYKEAPVRVYRRQTQHPSAKGMLYKLETPEEPRDRYPDVWCCYPTLPLGPVAMADGSALLGTWADFLPSGELAIDDVSGIGFPVITTWYGVEGRDR